MSGYTPGPWTAHGYVNEDAGWFVRAPVIDGRGKSIAGSGAGPISEANARLIAATTQMADALAHYADQLCEGWCEQSPDCAHFDDCGGCLARRVHFQATGAPLQAGCR